MAPTNKRGSGQRMANSLVALSSSAILAVYAAGYLRTRPAAERFAAEPAQRRTAVEPPPAAPLVSSPPTQTVSARATAPAQTTRLAPVPDPTAPVSAPAPAAAPATPATPPPPSAPSLQTDDPSVASSDQAEPVATTQAADAVYKDGAYLGWGSCRHGDIQASVVIESGQIVSATIAQCRTRYSCSWIEALPGQVVSRQSTNVDYVSGATESTDAFADAVFDALSKAK